MDKSPLLGTPVGYYTDWGAVRWTLMLAVLAVVVLVAAAAATARVELVNVRARESRRVATAVGFAVVALLGAVVFMWQIARHLPSWGWVAVFCPAFVAAVGLCSWGLIGTVAADSNWAYGVKNPVALPTSIAGVVAFAVIVGDGAARSGSMRGVPEGIATGAGIVLYLALVLVPAGALVWIKARR